MIELRAICRRSWLLAALLGWLTAPGAAVADVTQVAVAANFLQPAKEIAAAFEIRTGHKAALSFGATGQFYTQIVEGAPFEVLLSADQSTPKKLVEQHLAVVDSIFSYALGKLVLFSRDPKLVSGEQTLSAGRFGRIAIANPTTAPYGAAAVEVMRTLGVYDQLSGKIVTGSNIAQAFAFVESGNAELGFVALSEVIDRPGGSRWLVPAELYTPIRQDAALLLNGTKNIAARAWLSFLKGAEAAAIIRRYGYGLP